MIVADDFYLLRTPVLPLNFLEQFNGLPHARLQERLENIFTEPYMQEAIYIASPELYQEFQKWLQGYLTDEKDVNKLVLSLFRYLLRMSARCTPYGLFAGCSLGKFSAASQIKLSHPHQHKKHCRLDMNIVAELSAMISQLPSIQHQLQYFPNNSLYKIAGKYRYAEFSLKNKFRTYNLAEVACSDYLEKIINTALKGATSNELAEAIVDDDISIDEAKNFVLELVQNQLLVSEAEPAVTGEEFFTRLINKLSALENTSDITGKLTCIHELLQHKTTGADKYLQTHALVKELLPGTNNKDLVQTDLFLNTQHNTISSVVITGIQQQLEKLWSLARLSDSAHLKSFRDAFKERYEEQEIPLVTALDAEAGIGYAGYGSDAGHAPLIDDIVVDKANDLNTISWSKMHDFQLKKLHNCLNNKAVEIEITDKDLDELKETNAPLIPDSLYLIGSLLGESAAAIDTGNYQFELMGSGGPSAANLLGRFCHADEELTRKVKSCLRQEEQHNPHAIYAEVVHLPEARTGNVLLRPQLRNYEIVYLGNGSVPPDHQIPLTDLMVSVHQDTIILRSKKLNKRIIPRLSTAHNFSAGSLPAYKFLCDLQLQQLHGGVSWQWNAVIDEPFLPRVRYGKIILSKCTWILQKQDYPELNQKNTSISINYTELSKKISDQLKLPQYVVITEGDNQLLINMNSESCLHILADTLVKKGRIVLQEFLNTEDKCFVEGEGGRYTNEIIVPLKRTIAVKQDDVKNKTLPGEETSDTFNKSLDTKGALLNRKDAVPERTFIAGSEWLYVKIYCGTNSAEKILKEIIRPLTRKLSIEDKIDKWFFVRYADPEHHIRVRFHHAENKGFWKEIIEALHAAMKDDTNKALACKIQIDTYQREIERYGLNTIELSEDIFYYDSEAVLDCIDLLEGEDGERYRWLLAIRGADMLLDDFGCNLTAKALLLRQLQQGSFKEFGGSKTLTTQLNDKYRKHMHVIRNFLDEKKDAENEIEEAIALFTMRSIRLKATINKMKVLHATGDTKPDMNMLLPSYIHMFLNRMFLSNQRKQEMVIYHFLSKYYDSLMAINKQQLQTI